MLASNAENPGFDPLLHIGGMRWVAHVYNPILSDWPKKVRRKAIVFTRGKNRSRGECMYENVKDQFLCILSKNNNNKIKMWASEMIVGAGAFCQT